MNVHHHEYDIVFLTDLNTNSKAQLLYECFVI